MGDFTEHFDWKDCFVSAKFLDISKRMMGLAKDNRPLEAVLYNTTMVAEGVRDEFPHIPLRMTSFFCNAMLANALRRAGYPRAYNSLHFYGLAFDFTTWHDKHRHKLRDIYEYLKTVPHAQLILYKEETGYRNIHFARRFRGYPKITTIKEV